MRLVLDTNIVASGLLWNGTPAQLLDAARTGDLELFTTFEGRLIVSPAEALRIVADA